MLKRLQQDITKFCSDRDWDQYHDPVHLSIGLVTEASELLDIFRFKNKEQAEAMFKDPQKRTEIEEEAADTLYFLLRLAHKYDIDLERALEDKMRKNREKYPVGMVKGKNKKYNEY